MMQACLPQTNILIFGAGAVGRGFLPYVLSDQSDIGLSFVERDPRILNLMSNGDSYRIAMTGDGSYDFKDVKVNNVYAFGDNIDVESYDLVFSAVGVDNSYKLADYYKRARAVITCENDAESALKLRSLTGNPNIYFGIPDVITSNSAPRYLRNKYPLMTVTGKGALITERGNYRLPDNVLQVSNEELERHWLCKFFLHNAPHAMIAYLGWLGGYTYIHKAMADPDIGNIVKESMWDLAKGLIHADMVDEEYAYIYAERELSRFKNELLFDPIERVARDPLRKLSPNNRLILGCYLCFIAGRKPQGLAMSIKAAMEYLNPADEQSVRLQKMRKEMSDYDILEKYSGIDKYNPLGRYIVGQEIDEFYTKRVVYISALSDVG